MVQLRKAISPRWTTHSCEILRGKRPKICPSKFTISRPFYIRRNLLKLKHTGYIIIAATQKRSVYERYTTKCEIKLLDDKDINVVGNKHFRRCLPGYKKAKHKSSKKTGIWIINSHFTEYNHMQNNNRSLSWPFQWRRGCPSFLCLQCICFLSYCVIDVIVYTSRNFINKQLFKWNAIWRLFETMYSLFA